MERKAVFMDGRFNIVKIAVFPKVIYIFIAILKIPRSAFAETKIFVLKFIWTCKGPKIANTIKKEKQILSILTF